MIWELVEDEGDVSFNGERGKISKVSPKDCLFMTLTVFRHGGIWDSFLSRMIKCKGSNFEKFITRFITFTAPIFKCIMIDIVEQTYTMTKLKERGNTFEKYDHSRCTADVCFQQSKQPSGNIQEASPWYSGRHKLHRYQFEASVPPVGLCLSCIQHARGGRSDLKILESYKKNYKTDLKKEGE